jgi:hypothetical protein
MMSFPQAGCKDRSDTATPPVAVNLNPPPATASRKMVRKTAARIVASGVTKSCDENCDLASGAAFRRLPISC